MKKTYAFAFLFFLGLGLLWWLEYAKFPRERERLARASRVLRSLFDAQLRDIREVEIERAGQVIRFEREDNHPWQMVKPIRAAADPAMVDNLIQNLIDLPRSPDAGTIEDSGQGHGLAPPSAVIRIAGGRRSKESSFSAGISAVLEVGKRQGDVRFVRPAGEDGIEAVDEKLLRAIDLPIADWREKALLPLPTFQIVGMTMQTGSGIAYQAIRDRSGRWALREPIAVPADGVKIDNLLAQLTGLRVEDGAAGFAADGVRDFGRFGLDSPELTVTLDVGGSKAEPIVLQFGKQVPDHADRVYARRRDQDNVVVVNSKILANIPRAARDLRTGQVTQIEPGRVTKVEFDAPPPLGKIVLQRNPTGWEQTEPRIERVDLPSIQTLVEMLGSLQSSELLDPEADPDPRMSPRLMTVKIWESPRLAAGPNGAASEPRRTLSLQLGQHDLLRKTVYARLEGDSFILALPDVILKAMPSNPLSFRDRTVLALNPATIKNLRVTHEGRTIEIVPSSSNEAANRWKMVAPINADVDMPALSQVFAALSQLRAEEIVEEARDDKPDRQFGLDHPSTELVWEYEAGPNPSPTGKPTARGRLRIGKQVGRSSTSAYYARLDHLPMIFTLGAPTVGILQGELHDRRVLSFDVNRVNKIAIRWPNRTIGFTRIPGTNGETATWTPDSVDQSAEIPLSQISTMLTQVARLQTNRFLQYRGIYPIMTGLRSPRLTMEIRLDGESDPRILRIGNMREDGLVYAAAGAGETGPVFFLPATGWNQLIKQNKAHDELPSDLFSPPIDGSSPTPSAK